jgi:TolA-binding protein
MTVIFLVCLWGASALANTPENRAFNAAAEAFRGGFYERADREFGDFAVKYPTSPRIPEAHLLRAQARVQLGNQPGAIELLHAAKAGAGALADQYAFWLAEATIRQKDFASAADLFGAVVANFPASPRALEAAINEAASRAQLSQWPRITSALGHTNSPYQAALSSSRTNALVARGAVLLAQAHLSLGSPQAAEDALKPLADVPLEPALEWQRQHLLCRVRIAQDRIEDALVIATNLTKLASAPGDPIWAPESASLYAGLLTTSGRVDEALAVYERNLLPSVPESYQRAALLKISELGISKNRQAYAAAVLDKFAAQQPQSPALDVALLASGELKLREYASLLSQAPEMAERDTNLLDAAISSFGKFAASFTNSPLVGKASLNMGWCFWLEQKYAESRDAFARAAARLPKSQDQAIALFKLGDAHFKLGAYTNALDSYSAVVSGYSDDPQARTNLIERALYQTVRAAIALPEGSRSAATNGIAKLIQWFPDGLLAERSVLLGGIEISKTDPVEARHIYSEFARSFPNAEMLPEVQLALARSYEQQSDWTNAIAQYDVWLARHTNDPAIPRAEYSRAWANAQAGRATNAFALFSSFVTRFPNTEFTAEAHWWLGDYHLQNGQLENAERAYKTVFQNTNWAGSQLAYMARMMAGRVAFKRQGGTEAADYFTGLWNDTNCPMEIRAQALFAYGDTLMTIVPAETNKVASYDEAIRVFSRLCDMFPSNRIGALAWGQKASCLLQWAQASEQYDAASNAFQQVISSPHADGRARATAKVGLASVLEKQAEQAPARKPEMLKLAMNHCLDVFFGSNGVWRENETADPFWVRKAGIEAARLAEALEQWPQAIKIYQRIQELMPVLRSRMDRSIARAQENMSKN